ncbi:NPCBM-associated, NEW3 domain of alpha-galactosidase [Methanosarcina siciliae T4/M]|uniref:NPCBM-associated, NEW3 domain of alpha-galactosidase n=2 Tax=Methanosarcina siciliae TaxID=38027 RepID=A0A0E3PHH8_9EURY|nr:COG1361 S-layer family protein [Methanosarcina siciliae]AKB30329.1 NPCBM-associated, NEW3 domain of alpha-galactosidase [Methanosarcina siciliae T4/M]AKB34239.1 NPCBM-associated, NEW3 domain of alpha-galactosidase [Methanosarcina siciliae HI350]
MGIKNFVIFICVVLIGLSLCSGTVFAASTLDLNNSLDKGISIDLLNQDPDPVNPGDVLEVRVAIENSGYNDIEDCYLKIEPEYPFRALSGEGLTENIGTLGKRSEDERRRVVKFKVRVENDVNEGQYPLKVYLYSTDSKNKISLNRELTIDINSESNAEIEYISVEKLIPGEKTTLSFGIKNVGNSPLKNSMFSWECTNDLILPVGSSNVKHINLIDVGETANVSFEVLTNVNTKPGLYKLDMVLTYDDIEELQTITEAGYVENQKRKTIESKAGIYIGGTTDFDIAFMERSPTGAYTFSVSNIGNNGANSVKISVPLQENWTVTDGGSNSAVLGNLQKGDFTIADFNLEPRTIGENLPIKFEISYTSSDGMRQVEEKVFSLYVSPVTLPVGSKMQEESNESGLFSYKLGLLILLGAVGFFIYKKHQKRLKEKNADGNWQGENSPEEQKPEE